MQAISAIGIFSSVVFAFLLYHKKSKSYPDKILFIWMFVFVIHLILPFMMAIGNRFFIEKVNGLDIGLYTLHITFLYYYSLGLTNASFRFEFKHLLYLIPTAIIYLVQEPIDANIELFSDIVKRYFHNNNAIFHLTGVVCLNVIFCIYFCNKFFMVLSSFRKKIKNNYSYSKDVDLRWLKNFHIAALALTSVGIFFLIGLLKGILSPEWLNHIYFSIISILAVLLGYWGYKQGIILVYSDTEEKESGEQKINNKSADTGINSSVLREETGSVNLHEKGLQDLMREEKPYLDPTLNIGTVANTMGIHAHQLSKLINGGFNQNFFEFVNTYRIEEFKKLVADPKNKNFSILGLALDAGFNSKATFNRIFKNYTGQTPSEFRENFKC